MKLLLKKIFFNKVTPTMILLLSTVLGHSQWLVTDAGDIAAGTQPYDAALYPCNTATVTQLRVAIHCALPGDVIEIQTDITLSVADAVNPNGTGQLALDKSLTINGNGHTLNANGSTGFNIAGWNGAPSTTSGIFIDNITVDNADYGINISDQNPIGNDNISLTNIEVTNSARHGIIASGSDNLTITNFTGTNIGDVANSPQANGIQLTNSNSAVITNPTINGTVNHGVFVETSSDLLITGGIITNASESGLRFEDIIDGNIEDINSSFNDHDGINVTNSTNVLVTGGIFNSNGQNPVPFNASTGTGGEGRGVYIGNSTNIDITNSTFNNNAYSGGQLSLSTGSDFDDTEFNRNGLGGGATDFFHGLSLGGSTDNSITNSTFSENLKNGIEFNQESGASSDDNIIGGSAGNGNTFDNNGRIGIALQGGASDLTITYNTVTNHTVDAGIQLNTTDDPMSNIVIGENIVQTNLIGIQVLDGNVVEDIDISNNKIGADAAGNTGAGLGNIEDGIQILSPLSGITVHDNIVINSGNNGINISSQSPKTIGSTLNVIQGNYIGFDASFNEAPNGESGININDQTVEVQIGGTGVGEGNYIAGNIGNGISIGGATTSTVSDIFLLGNTIGATPNTPVLDTLGNRLNGIFIDYAQNVVVGGIGDSANVIVANTNTGIFIGGNGVVNQLKGNFIGTSSSGTDSYGNGEYGIQVEGGNNHIIGGTEAGQGNLIAANNGLGGILINGGTDTEILGNFIGIQKDLSDTISSVGDGITVNAGNHFIGLTSGGTVAGNTISGHDIAINLLGGSSVVDGNIIGVDNGTTVFGNGVGIVVASDGNTIGQTGNGNIVLGSESNGIEVTGSSNTITDNLVQNNGTNGISMTGGATNTVDNNTIGGNIDRGIYIDGTTDATIIANTFGQDELGVTNPHTTEDILIVSGNNIDIGDATVANANVFSGAVVNHINISGGTDIDVIKNYFGVDETETAVEQSTGSAIVIGGTASNVNVGGAGTSGNTIFTGSATDAAVFINGTVSNVNVDGNYIGVTEISGGTAVAGNTIATAVEITGGADANIGSVAGNNIGITSSHAIHVNNGTGDIVIENNNVGTDDTGINTDPNLDIAEHGVFINTTNGVTVNNNIISNINNSDFYGVFSSNSNSGTIEGNIVFQNADNGIQLSGSSNNTVSNNTSSENLNGIGLDASSNNTIGTNNLGTDAAGSTTDLGNISAGVTITNGAESNTLTGNIVAYNDLAISVDGTVTSNQNFIEAGSYYCNDQGGTGGIQLIAEGNNNILNDTIETKKPVMDPNTDQLYLDSLPPGALVQIYQIGSAADGGAECETCRQGKTFLGNATVAGDSTFVFGFGSDKTVADCGLFTITVTDTDGNTSEFSDCSTCPCFVPPAEYISAVDTTKLCPDDIVPTYTIDTLSTDITGTGPFEYEWYTFNNDSTVTTTGITTLDFTPPAQADFDTVSYVFRIKFVGADCENFSSPTTIVTYGRPTLEPIAKDTLCPTDTKDYTSDIVATNFESLSWSIADVDPVSNVYTPSTSTGDTVSFMLTANAYHTCLDSAIEVKVFLPQTPVVEAGNSIRICAGRSFTTDTLTPSVTQNFESLLWSSAFGSFTDEGELLTAEYTPSSITADSTVKIYLEADGIGDCPNHIDSVDIELLVSPEVDAGSDTIICVDESIDLATLVTPPSEFGNVSRQWSIVSGAGTFDSDLALQPVFTPAAGTTGDIVLNLRIGGAVAGDCQFVEDQVTITVNSAPDVTFTSIDDICEGDTIDLSIYVTIDTATVTTFDWITSESDGSFIAPDSQYVHGANAGGIDPILSLNVTPLVGCTFTDISQTFDVQVKPQLMAGVSDTICIDDSYNITDFIEPLAIANDFSWATDNGGGTFSPTNTLTSTYTPITSDIGKEVNLTLTTALTSNNSDCADTSATVTLLVNPLPDVTFIPIDDICEDDTIDLSSYVTIDTATVTTFDWITSESDGSFIAPDSQYVHGVNAGSVGPILTLGITPLTGCTFTDLSQTFDVQEKPEVTAGILDTICIDDTYSITDFTSSGADGFSWTSSLGTGIFNPSNTLNSEYIPGLGDSSKTVDLKLTVSLSTNIAACSDTSATVSLHINQLPNFSFDPITGICQGDSVDLSSAVIVDSTVKSFEWSTNESDGVFSPDEFSQGGTLKYDHGTSATATDPEITLSVEALTGCTDDFILQTFTVSPAPVITLGPNGEVCELTAFDLLGTVIDNEDLIGGISWDDDGAAGTFNDNTLENPIYTPATADIGDTINLIITATRSASPLACQEKIDTILLVVNEQPEVVPNDTFTCVNEAVELPLIDTSAINTLTWSVLSPSIGTLDATNILQPEFTPNVLDAGTSVSIQVETNDNGACLRDIEIVDVVVNSLPTATLIADDLVICASGSVNLTAGGGDSYDWYSPNLGSGTNKNQTPLDTTTYSVQVTDVNGCLDSASVTVNVNPNLPINVDIIDPAPQCEGEDLTFSINTSTLEEPTTTTREWYVNGIATGESGLTYTASFNEGDLVSVILESDAECIITNSSITGTVGNWIFNSDDEDANFIAKPIGLSIDGSLLYCFDEQIDLTLTTSDPSSILTGDSIVWTRLPDGTNSEGYSPATTNPGVGNYNYSVTVFNSATCFTTVDENVEIRQVDVSLNVSDNNIIIDEPVTLTALATNVPSNSPVDYSWDHSTSAASSLTETPEETSTYVVTATDQDLPNCKDSDEIVVFVKGVPTVFDVFTPPISGDLSDGDGKNDTWQIKDIEGYDKAIIKVFNRWGNVIYRYDNENDDYNDNAWRGTSNKGNAVPVATYYYVIELNDDSLPKDRQTLQGYVAVIR